MDTGRRSGHGRVMLLYFELCESIWGGSSATQQLETGIESQDIQSAPTNSSSNPPSPLNISATTQGEESDDVDADESQPLMQAVEQRRNLLDSKLKNYKQEKLKRKLPVDNQ